MRTLGNSRAFIPAAEEQREYRFAWLFMRAKQEVCQVFGPHFGFIAVLGSFGSLYCYLQRFFFSSNASLADPRTKNWPADPRNGAVSRPAT